VHTQVIGIQLDIRYLVNNINRTLPPTSLKHLYYVTVLNLFTVAVAVMIVW